MTARHCLKRVEPCLIGDACPAAEPGRKREYRYYDASDNCPDEAQIQETMAAPNAALNSGKRAEVLPLYTEVGVFMPPYSQSAVGKSAVSTACDKVFAVLFRATDFPGQARSSRS